MLFNSIEFLLFLPVVFGAYWLVSRHLRAQNLLIVVASYVFYGWWDWRFLILMGFTSLWSYVVGVFELRHFDEREKGSRPLLFISMVVNFGILGYFKYCNFFIDQAQMLLNALGFNAHCRSLQVILPVGISFYTFQALSYTIDVYRRTIRPTRDPIAFFAFISFFPQLVAGPIERATNLLPQFIAPRAFDYPTAVSGCRQILWGFFKKVMVADSCAFAANAMLADPNRSSISTWVGMICFTFQIYGDFSGYSDIAIGCGKLFGIRLMRNFAYPYFARDIAEFWRRWHISLTTWFRDYLYIPLGGSRCGTWKKVRNTFAIFLVSGFWHGANWTFIAWGAFHAVCFLPLLLLNRNRRHTTDVVAEHRMKPTLGEAFCMATTFILAVVGWTFFRAPDIATAGLWLGDMFSFSNFRVGGCSIGAVAKVWLPLLVMLSWEWVSRRGDIKFPSCVWLRWVVYLVLFAYIVVLRPVSQTFIYFQF